MYFKYFEVIIFLATLQISILLMTLLLQGGLGASQGGMSKTCFRPCLHETGTKSNGMNSERDECKHKYISGWSQL